MKTNITALDILLIILTAGLWIFVIIYKANKQNKAQRGAYGDSSTYNSYYNNSNAADDIDQIFIDQRNRSLAEERYAPYVDQHFKNVEEIGVKYSVLNNSRVYFGRRMDELIALCKRDIELAPIIKQYYNEMFVDNRLPTYESYKRLAIIYEKRREYAEAAQVCASAIMLGFDDDGTTGKMYGRLARLLRLRGVKQTADEFLQKYKGLNVTGG